tara:strand:- start:1629 stop:2486 length:858 start_codon:yes stop_codon:yes gene_type:complete
MIKMATYTEKFNFYLKTFIGELISIFPEFTESLTKNYSKVLDSENLSSDEFVKEYMLVMTPHHTDISKKNDKLFLGENELNFFRDIDFRDLWTKDLSDSTRENLWKYLQTLFVLGKRVVTNKDELDVTQMLNDFNVTDKADLKNNQTEMMNMINNMSKITDETKNSDVENLFNNGIISDIAKELTNELDLDNMNMGNPQNMNEAFGNIMGGGGGDFFNLISKVGEKIQKKVENGQINQNDLIKEAQKMMGGLQNPQQMANVMKNKGKESTKDRLRRKLQERKDKL